MGLDVYVGTLTRYYGGDWSLITQQMGAGAGVEVRVIHPGELPGGESGRAQAGEAGTSQPTPPDVWLDRIERWLNKLSAWGGGSPRTRTGSASAQPRSIAEDVARWRSYLNEELAGRLPHPLDWDESETAPYFTDKPAWDGYACLMLLAAHDEHPELPRPTIATDNWTDDPAWELSSRRNFAHTRYASILAPNFWLPGEFDFILPTQDLAGEDIELGSSVALLAQLRELNARTYRGSPDELAQWLWAGPEPGEGVDLTASPAEIKQHLADVPDEPVPFDYTARFALALFLDLAEKSVAHRLPMKLDW
jgi:hypothetical protein